VPRRLDGGARLVHLVLGRRQVGRRDVEGRLRLLELLLRHERGIVAVQLLGALERALRLIAVRPGLHGGGLGRGQGRARLLEVRLVHGRVDLQQELAPLDEVALRTPILVMRPVMSALMSTFFLGWILPLAVTAATRSRRCTFSNRTSMPRSRRAAALTTSTPTITTAAPTPTRTLLRLDMASRSSPYRSGRPTAASRAAIAFW